MVVMQWLVFFGGHQQNIDVNSFFRCSSCPLTLIGQGKCPPTSFVLLSKLQVRVRCCSYNWNWFVFSIDVRLNAVFLPMKACSWTTACCSWSAWGLLMPTMTSTLTTTSPASSAWRTCSVRWNSKMHKGWTNGWKDVVLFVPTDTFICQPGIFKAMDTNKRGRMRMNIMQVNDDRWP